jgi:hypothetical protein
MHFANLTIATLLSVKQWITKKEHCCSSCCVEGSEGEGNFGNSVHIRCYKIEHKMGYMTRSCSSRCIGSSLFHYLMHLYRWNRIRYLVALQLINEDEGSRRSAVGTTAPVQLASQRGLTEKAVNYYHKIRSSVVYIKISMASAEPLRCDCKCSPFQLQNAIRVFRPLVCD